jgi:L,D-peptidoglycan transpeptidase YkuD (ErfK/YbiS/YcfS/YnhG family)
MSVRRGVALLVMVLVASLLVVPPAVSAPAYHPSQLRHLGDARQVVVVTSPSWRSSYATLRAYRQDADGRWHLRFGPWRARVGYAGMAPAATRRQNTGTTPAGTFRMLSSFGSMQDPGSRLGYRRFDGNDWWPYDPRDAATYNVLQPFRSGRAQWRPAWAERLAHWGAGAYRYGVVLDYNLPSEVHWSKRLRQYVADRPADTRKGGGIFLHVNGSGATAGCVSVGLRRMRQLLRWLNADRHPRIVIAPLSAIDGA